MILLDTVTALRPEHRGGVIVAGSHGGRYCGLLAAAVAPRGIILHDAGIGLDGAGVAGILALERFGVAAAAATAASCRIADAADLAARGRVGTVNAVAADLGVVAGMAVAEAALAMRQNLCPTPAPVPPPEGRATVAVAGRTVRLVDSLSMIDRAADEGAILVAGSHGALLGGSRATDPGLPVRPALLVVHDAGGGGTARLAVLDEAGVPAVAVDGTTARIGEAASVLGGRMSAVNRAAGALGARTGMTARAFIASAGAKLGWPIEGAGERRRG